MGRIQHVATGAYADFASGAELVEWLTQHAQQLSAQSTSTEQDPTLRPSAPKSIR